MAKSFKARLGAVTVSFVAMSGVGLAQPVDQLEEVVVTGSRIAGDPLNATQPVLTVSAEELQQRGITSIGDAVETIPALLASNNVEQTARDGLAGRVSLNLRNMGVNRTLVLVNGRRHVAGIPGSAAVDITSIPSSLVERIDVLTGGAAAVYGSDAVTGVVNFVTKRDFVGTEIEAQGGLSFEGDAGRYFVSAVHGLEFADGRGNLAFALQTEKRDLLFQGDRAVTRGNGIWTRDQNPALRFQAGDPLPPGVSANTALGNTILRGTSPRYANTPQSLIDRARNAPARAFGPNQVFSGSAVPGLIGLDLTRFGYADPAGSFGTLHDTNRDGVDDCRQSFNGRRGFGCWIVDPSTGQVRPFNDGIYLGTFNQQGGDGAAQSFDETSMTPDASTNVVNVLSSFEVTESARVYGEFKYVESKAREYNPYASFDDSIPISLDNPFIPAALRAIANAEIAADPSVASTAQFVVSRDHVDVFDPLLANTRKTYRAVVGVEGDLSDNWKYDVSLNYGRSDAEYRSAMRLEDRFFSAVDAVIDPRTGQPTCRINLNPNSRAPISALTPGWDVISRPTLASIDTFDPRDGSCRPLNVFSYNPQDRGTNDFLNYIRRDESRIEQTVAQAIVSGDSGQWFELPGGPVAVAFGAEWREERSRFINDDYAVQGYGFQFAADSNLAGKYDVTEGFIEVSLPLLSGVPFFEVLNIDASFRGGEYSTAGSADSWKVGMVWSPIEGVRLRGGIANTIRAPNISELFLPETASTFRPVDPCDQANRNSGPSPANRARNCLADGIPGSFTDPLTARFTGVVSGNGNLGPEESESYTYGIVLVPSFLPGFSASIDYWNIDITNAIASISAQNIVDGCYDAPSLDNQFCKLFTRNRNAGSPTFLGFNFLRQQDVNFAGLEVSGVDFDLDYRLDTDAAGRFSFGVGGSYLEKRNNFEFFGEPDRANPEKLELNNPEWVVNTSIGWQKGPIGVRLDSTWWDRQLYRIVEVEVQQDTVDPLAPEMWVHSISARYELSDSTTIIAGIDNLADEKPFRTEYSIPVSAVGRSVFVRASMKF